jgi:hypothetical protein
MIARWIRRMAAVVVVVVLTAGVATGAQAVTGWMTNIQPGSAVRVTMKTGEAFDAIWMGRDGERAVFERFDPHETISVPQESVRRMRTRRSSPSSNAAYMTQLGIATGVFGVFAIIGLMLRGR